MSVRQSGGKRDYQKELDAVLDGIGAGIRNADALAAGSGKPSLLLHACCAPCSSYVLEYLVPYFAVTVYYYNPNIYPEEEYRRRLGELRSFLPRFAPARSGKVRLVEAEYNPEDYFAATDAREDPALQTEPERGERCRRCYEFRIKKAAEYAALNGFDWFCTTLSISPFKDAPKINTIGEILEASGKLRSAAGRAAPRFLPCDFKKRNGFLRSLQLSAEYGLYRQDYCGCVYSWQRRHTADASILS